MARNVKTLSKAVPETVRLHNRAILLNLLYPNNVLTRADLARASGLTRVAISGIVAELEEEGLLREVGLSQQSGPGKRGILLRLRAESRSIIAIDLSSPYVFRGAVTNLLGQVSARHEIALGADQSVSVDLVGQLCDWLMAAAKGQGPVLGIGVAVPGIISEQGVIDETTSLGWEQLNLRSYLAERSGLAPELISLENDANSEVLAEQQYGSGGSNLLMVHLARGVGAGLLVSGRLVRGRNRAAGEIGHVVIDPAGPQCTCGKRGCLETFISVPILTRQIEREPEHTDDILHEAGQMLGAVLSMPVGVLDMPQVSLLGQARIVSAAFVRGVDEALNAAVGASFRKRVAVSRSSLGEDADLLGACANVVSAQLYGEAVMR